MLKAVTTLWHPVVYLVLCIALSILQKLQQEFSTLLWPATLGMLKGFSLGNENKNKIFEWVQEFIFFFIQTTYLWQQYVFLCTNLCTSSHSSTKSTEGNHFFLCHHILEVFCGPLNMHTFDGLCSFSCVLNSKEANILN